MFENWLACSKKHRLGVRSDIRNSTGQNLQLNMGECSWTDLTLCRRSIFSLGGGERRMLESLR
jgi:hypothetical protein